VEAWPVSQKMSARLSHMGRRGPVARSHGAAWDCIEQAYVTGTPGGVRDRDSERESSHVIEGHRVTYDLGQRKAHMSRCLDQTVINEEE
jgi:hypothetical protein